MNAWNTGVSYSLAICGDGASFSGISDVSYLIV